MGAFAIQWTESKRQFHETVWCGRKTCLLLKSNDFLSNVWNETSFSQFSILTWEKICQVYVCQCLKHVLLASTDVRVSFYIDSVQWDMCFVGFNNKNKLEMPFTVVSWLQWISRPSYGWQCDLFNLNTTAIKRFLSLLARQNARLISMLQSHGCFTYLG